MGEVYRAVQAGQERPVAVKFLNPLADGQTPVLAFQRESHVMASLHHPNVVAIYDYGQTRDRYYLVMEYVAGANLRSQLETNRPWPISRAAPLLDAIARALSYIHGQGILHLDLKPENVLCTTRGEVKISDFGLAVPRVDARILSEKGLSQGTIDYCAPEQRYGLPIDQRSDLFSLATMAYELLTGRLPGRVYFPASARSAGLPAAVDEVLRQGLARDPDERYPSVEVFRRELAAALKKQWPGHALWAAVVGRLRQPWHR